VKDQYYNLYEVLKDKPEIIELAKKAMKEAGIDPIIRPVRGGTDGSRLTFMGLPRLICLQVDITTTVLMNT